MSVAIGKGTLIYDGGKSYEGVWKNNMLCEKEQNIYCEPFPGDDYLWILKLNNYIWNEWCGLYLWW